MVSANGSGTRVRHYKQRERGECGITCVQMILSAFGRHVPIEAMRAAAGDARHGTSARDLLAVARRFGIRAGFRVRVEPGELASMPPPLILHWDFQHFVVLECFDAKRGIRIVDPMAGAQWMTGEALSTRFTGVALFFWTAQEPDTGDDGAPCHGLAGPRPKSPFRPGIRPPG